MPSHNEEMMRIKHSIQKDLLKYNNTEHVVTVCEVVGAVSKLQKNKSDGEAGLWSNHIINASHRYMDLIHAICLLVLYYYCQKTLEEMCVTQTITEQLAYVLA